MQNSLKTCVAVLLACIMVLEIPLFAFADTAAGVSGDTAGAQTEEQLGNSGDEQGSESIDNDTEKQDLQEKEDSDAIVPSDDTAGVGTGDNLTEIDLSGLLTQLEQQSDDDSSSPRPLPVPNAVKDGNYFFIGCDSYSVSEQSTEKLYIPIQRTGDLSEEASVTLKLIDVTSHKGVNYKAEIYGEDVEGVAEYGDVSMVDIISENTENTYESSGITEDELSELIKENGGEIEVLDSDDKVVGKLTSDNLMDSTGEGDADAVLQTEDPDAETSQQQETPAVSAEDEEGADDGAQLAEEESAEDETQAVQLTGTGNPLKDARNVYTGVVSDRQELIQSSELEDEESADAQLSEASEDADEDSGIVEDEFVGTEYTLTFAAGEDAKYLVITPLYSAKAEGDSMLQLLLRDPTGDFAIEESTRSSYVTITDCDELEDAYISIADTELYVTADKAAITVTRSGATNNMLCVNISTIDGTAEAGTDFSGVGAKLYFPMGITKRTVEIPVGHGDSEKTFTVQLSNPTDCSIINAKVEVTISAYGDSDTAQLEDSADKIDSRALNSSNEVAFDDSYIGGSYDLSMGTVQGNAWYNSDTGMFVASGVGQSNDTWAGGKFSLEGGYLYDGVRVTTSLESKSPSWGVESIGLDNAGGYSIKSDTDRYNEWVIDMLYDSESANTSLSTMTLTSYAHGRTLRVSSIETIKRSFTFQLENAAGQTESYISIINGSEVQGLSGLKFENVDDAEALKYQKVILNSNLTDTSCTVKSNQNFSVSAIGTEYAKFVGIDAICDNGMTYRIANVDPNTRTCVITVDSDTINKLASADCIEWESKSLTVGKNAERDGDSSAVKKKSYSGVIRIRPVFEYIDATVQINSTDGGYLTVNNKPYTESKEVSFHLGDRLTLSSTPTAENTTALGISYSQSASNGTAITKSGTENFLSDSLTYTIDQKYNVIEPTFNQEANTVKVRVAKSDFAYLDKNRGFLATATCEEHGDDYVYTAYSNVKANKVIQLYAYAASEDTALLWKEAKTSDTYSGNVFYIIADPSADKNVIRLSVDTDASSHAYYTLSGTVVTPVMNLSTGNAVENTSMYASDAMIAVSAQGDVTDEKGAFDIDPFYAMGGTKIRYAVTYNGSTELKETALPSSDTKGKYVPYQTTGGTTAKTLAIPVTADYVSVSAYSLSGAHVTGVDVAQDKLYVTTAAVLEANGKQTVLQAYVHDGDLYKISGVQKTEKVKAVYFFFVDPKTNTIHGNFKARKQDASDKKLPAGTSLWTYTIDKFAIEDSGSEYSYGDVLYVQIVSDKKLVENVSTAQMEYRPVSTGYSVISDNDYAAQNFEMDPPIDAASIIGGVSTQDDETRVTYGQFPFIGEINFVAAVIAKISSGDERARKDLESTLDNFANDYDAGLASDEASLQGIQSIIEDSRRVQVTIVMVTKVLPYGGTRLLLGVRAAVGTSNFEEIANPYRNIDAARDTFEMNAGMASISQTGAVKFGEFAEKSSTLTQMKMGGPYAKVSLQVGLYIDFGYIEIETSHDDGTVDYSHDIVLLGGGCFIGGTLSVGSYLQTMLTFVPCYFGFDAGVTSTIFFGVGANPNKTLKTYLGGSTLNTTAVNLEWVTNVYASGYAGVGLIGALGVRGTVTLSVEIGASSKMADWYPNVGSSWGLLSTFTISGTVDVVGVTIPLGSYSWALPGSFGFYGYFKEVRMGNNVIKYVNEAITDLIKDGKSEKYQTAIDTCNAKIKNLEKKIDSYKSTADEIEALTDDLRDYAYDNDILSTWGYLKSTTYTISGLASLTDDESAETAQGFYISEHTDSEWVAGEGASLEGAYNLVKETEIVNNAYSQPSTKLISIGDNKMLMVFLDTDSKRDASQQAVLKYSIYDSDTGRFTLAEVIQNDGTGDTTPNLCDAGDYIMVSWASADPEKYAMLDKEESEKDPTTFMSCYEIYTVLFNKCTQEFGEIEQLTDDNYYDNTPQGVYDSKSGDRVVLYLKSAPDTKQSYKNNTDKLYDYLNPYSGKVYTTVVYMLYDASQGKWAKDYYYDNEVTFDTAKKEKDYIATWKGQRFLPSVLKDDTAQNDPAITDLTVSMGYNGIAAYAYTVDTDYNTDTTEDKELYLQFYNFAEHKTYVPIRLTDDKYAQSMPQLVRNNDNTYLFWLEGTDTLKYINVSELLKAKYEVEITGKDGQTKTEYIYLIDSDGQLADGYDIEANIVDNHSYTYTDDDPMDQIGTYQVFTDANDDLYVVWTRTEARDYSDPDWDIYTPSAKEIYATAMVKESNLTEIVDGGTVSHAKWSKPYKLTSRGKVNDGVAAALDDSGNLILAYNQYTVEYNYGYKQDVKGEMYNTSPISLMAARLEPTGSLEATQIIVSDETPNAGDTITVGIALENTGLTAVRGAEVKVYTCKDGKRSAKPICVYTGLENDTVLVNTRRTFTFQWTVPEDYEGMQLVCVTREKNKSMAGGDYPEQAFESDVFEKKAELSATLVKVEQQDDEFAITYTVTNSGNTTAEKDTTAQIHLAALYGDAKDKYGVDDTLLVKRDVSDINPGESRTITQTAVVPSSVFKYCGYDQLNSYIVEPDGETVAYASTDNTDDAVYIMQEAPLNFTLNGGEDITLKKGESKTLEASYDGIAFLNKNVTIAYTVADTSVATVENGVLTAVGEGTTTVTATILPYGNQATVELTVTNKSSSSGSSGKKHTDTDTSVNTDDTKDDEVVEPSGTSYTDCKHDGTCPIAKYEDATVNAWYHDAVHYVLDESLMNGVSKEDFAPSAETTRAMVATILNRIDGETAAKTAASFDDIAKGSYYENAVEWAEENGIVTGYSDSVFAPNDNVTREQMVAMLYRYAKYKGIDTSAAETADISAYSDAGDISAYALTAMKWAYGAGVIKGRSSETLAPKANITRAEIAQIIKNYVSVFQN